MTELRPAPDSDRENGGSLTVSDKQSSVTRPVFRRCSFGFALSRGRWCSEDATLYNPESFGSNGCHYGFCLEHGAHLKGYVPIPEGAERRDVG